ncbi:unnamed protein product, partial [Cyprideis torosa]
QSQLLSLFLVSQASLESEKSEDLSTSFPITIGTVPFRIPNSPQQPVLNYDVAADHVEGGLYIGPEFLLGQVYDGALDTSEPLVIYRPVYPCVPHVLPSQHNTPKASGGKNSLHAISESEVNLRLSSSEASNQQPQPSNSSKSRRISGDQKDR